MTDSPVYSQKVIKIYVSDRQLHLEDGQRTAKVYPIAVGKPSTPTPPGVYHVITKIVNPGDALGTRWLGLDIPNGPYGIHGTFQPESIGNAVSNGCIRLYNHNVEELFSLVRIGTTVVIDSFHSGPGGGAPGNYTKTYIVQPGDTLWEISRKFGVTVDDLVHLNNIQNPDNLEIGQELRIP